MMKKTIGSMVLILIIATATVVGYSFSESMHKEDIIMRNTDVINIKLEETNKKENMEEKKEETSRMTTEELIRYLPEISNDTAWRNERDKYLAETIERFGYRVYENLIDREQALKEEDFKILKKGQYINQEVATQKEAEYLGVIETIGMYDGEITYNSPNPNKSPILTNLYYKIGDNTYVVLLFKNNSSKRQPLESVEVWEEVVNSDGTYEVKKRELEID